MNRPGDPPKFKPGQIVRLIGTAGRNVQKLKVVHDPGGIGMVECYSSITKENGFYTRSNLIPIGR